MATVTLYRQELDTWDLPPICMRCGEPATLVRQKRFSWGPGWVLLLLFVSVILPLLFWVALIVNARLLKKMWVPVPLCERHRNHWLALQVVLFGGLAILALLFCATIVLWGIMPEPTQGELSLAGWFCFATVTFLVIMVFPAAILQTKVIRPTEITDQSITLTSVAKEFVHRVREERSDARRGRSDRLERAGGEVEPIAAGMPDPRFQAASAEEAERSVNDLHIMDLPEARGGFPLGVRVTIICCLVFLAAVVVLVPIIALTGGGHGSKVQHGNIEVFYTEGATKAEADRLAAYLLKDPAGAGHRRSVQLKKTADGYQFRMPIKKEFQNDQKVLQGLQFDGARISRDVFDGAAIEVHACDQHLKTLKTFPPRPDVRYGVVDGKIEVFFAANVEKADAQQLAKYLATTLGGEPAPARISFKLARRGAIWEVHMVVAQKVLQDPAVIADLRQARNDIAVNVFKGGSVEMHLCDNLLNVVDVLKE